MPADFTVIIPARYGSTRLPGKPLLRIGSETLIENVFNVAIKSNAIDVYVATDERKIADEVERFGGKVVLTGSDIFSGTDRLHEAAIKLNLPANRIIVNLQGDEYNFDPALINQVADALDKNKHASIATLCQKIISTDEMHNHNVVKVVTDKSGLALYFSRSAIPYYQSNEKTVVNSGDETGYQHIGIYAYRVDFLNIYVNLQIPEIESRESLEQLRAIYHGYRIFVQLVERKNGIEVNTNDDLDKARELVSNQRH